MPTKWTLRQLCRMLCPPSASSAPIAPRIVTPNTQLLAIDPDGSYSSEGWKPAREYPILKEAIALWYYQRVPSDKSQPSTGVEGPATCRAIATVMEENKIPPDKIQVYADLTSSWNLVSNLASLQSALTAFQQPSAPKSGNGSDMSAVEEMAFPDDSERPSGSIAQKEGMESSDNDGNKDSIQDELEAFLASTEGISNGATRGNRSLPEEEESYESDGGTRYLKDLRSGKWVHEALVAKDAPNQASNLPQTLPQQSTGGSLQDVTISGKAKNQTNPKSSVGSRKRKRAKFAAKNSKCWIYITGLPTDCTVEELQQVFTKAGIIDLDPESLLPKIKLYKHRDGPEAGTLKGDASICYARPESVELAVTLLDETPLRPSIGASSEKNNGESESVMKVERAKFQQHGESFDASRGPVSNAKRQVARLAAIQATDWDEGDTSRLSGGRKGLRIIVIKHVFDPTIQNMDDDKVLQELEKDLRAECNKFGDVEKITLFAKNREGVVIVKFAKPGAASEAIGSMNGQKEWRKGGPKQQAPLLATFWDGVTDFRAPVDDEKESQEMDKRHEEFGKWLEQQQDELPEELRLKSVDD